MIEGITVTFKATIVAEYTGIDATTLYNSMLNSITTSVESGDYATNLAQAFTDFNVTNTFAVDQVVVATPPEPTGMPSTPPPPQTAVPTPSPTSPAPVDSSGDDSSFSTVNIIIIAVVVPVGVLICAVLAYFVMQERKKTAVMPATAMPVGLVN